MTPASALVTDPQVVAVLGERQARTPIFHMPGFARSPADCEAWLDGGPFEIDAAAAWQIFYSQGTLVEAS